MSETTVATYTLLLLALPLVSALVAYLIPLSYKWLVPPTSALLLLASAVLATALFFSCFHSAPIQSELDWFQLNGKTISAGILINQHTLVLLLVVTIISFLVHVFSIGYMAGDGGESRYFGMLGFFTFSMLGLVTAGNLLQLFIFWELVGFSSYALIGHWRERPEAASAAKKAFVINRVADLGFVAGLLMVWTATESFSITQLPLSESDSWKTGASLCFLIGVLGKSAQFPFFNWLPSAMEGPTPVSALIHAATMVVAGVFLLIRIFPLFTPLALDVVAIVGAITAVLGALAALHQFDLKKILAYSTISQLGLMLVAVGVGSPNVALLHLFTHAFFKAGLFLGAGAVIHALHAAVHNTLSFDVQDIRNLGGVRTKMPVTFLCFTLCSLGLIGFPLFAGFQSKDAILVALHNWSNDGWQLALFGIVILTSATSVAYTVRVYWFVFLAPAKKTSSLVMADVPVVMRLPMVLLAAGSLWITVDYHPLNFDGWLLIGLGELVGHNVFITWLSMILIPAISVLCVLYYHLRKKTAAAVSILQNGYFLDTLNTYAIEKPALAIAKRIEILDLRVIDRFLHLLAYLQITIAFVIGWVDKHIIDGLVNLLGQLSLAAGQIARSISNGKIQNYLLWPVLALVIFLFWVLF